LTRQFAHRWQFGYEPYKAAGALPKKFSDTSLIGRLNLRAIVRLQGLRALKKSMTPLGVEPHDLPACIIAPQTCTLQLNTVTTLMNKKLI
jgi:hypothetical protein